MFTLLKTSFFLLILLAVQIASAAYIVVDTGHTPQHPGAMGANGRVEYLYNLDMSNAVAEDLTAGGDRVLRVSADGKDIKLTERVTLAPDADLFVSIHHDSILQEWIDAGRRREFSGFALFVSEKNAHFEQSLSCAKIIGAQLLAIGEKPSLYHATPISGENRPLIDSHFGIHRYDDLVVLKTASIPAVLIEIGVIANPDEALRLNKSNVQQQIAHAISKGIHDCQVHKSNDI
ncbi:N-acetylmuramoyl-L-alanine amidase family protein [Sulfurirhabdus autotrophica]|uniref:N-acetylmuramoyl-L-alanine amidase n=1 Tax=Sulfurirhabdus autotrophica TaxID=1706046 RepID=A0A4R3YET2_9PROT|nr:N-acetylmuramoyl-L-alanine amidase [Sulfurirhabdus autotrophica]TCV90687.1 N-acetylmuramoyl-L-alanine amidase [Sulfurirhabdus autotrophica]